MDLDVVRDDLWKSQNVDSKLIHTVCHVFYPPAFAEAPRDIARDRSARQVGKVDDAISPSLSRVRGM